MLVKYKYRLYNGGRRGWYQADIADVRAWWRSVPKSDLVWVCVLFPEGTPSKWWGSTYASRQKTWRDCSRTFALSC